MDPEILTQLQNRLETLETELQNLRNQLSAQAQSLQAISEQEIVSVQDWQTLTDQMATLPAETAEQIATAISSATVKMRREFQTGLAGIKREMTQASSSDSESADGRENTERRPEPRARKPWL